jgi:uncharacterized RDD family membrane protein YckC
VFRDVPTLWLSGIFTLIVLIIDSLIYAVCGNTLGKWLCGIKIVDQYGKDIKQWTYFRRNMRVYWGGYGLDP